MQRTLNSRLLAAASRPVARRACLTPRRFYSDSVPDSLEPTPKTSSADKPGAKAGDPSAVLTNEGPSESMAKHNPDYSVQVDYRTS